MGASRDALATGPQDMVVVRSRPSLKLGFSILLAGAFLGGVIGISTRARQNAFDAAIVAAAQQQTPTPPPASPPPPVAALNGPNPTPLPNAGVTPSLNGLNGFNNGLLAPPGAIAGLPPGKEAKDPKDKHAAKHGGHVAKGGAAAPPREPAEKPEKPEKAEKPAKKGGDDGYRVASAGNDDPPPAPKERVSAKEKEPAEKESAKEKDPPKKKPAKSDDAASVLKAAMGATENTL